MATPPIASDPSPNGSPHCAHAYTNLCSLIGRALTRFKDVVTVSPTTPAREAIRLLTKRRFCQVPVVDRGQVAGLFSYRSFSLAVVVAYDLPGRHRVDELSVWECIETPAYVQGMDEIDRLFDELDRRDAVLIGSRSQCEGIVTTMGVLRYLFEAASPFLLVAEIELALRAMIELAVDADELGIFANTTLTHYAPEKIPEKLEDMTFKDYVLLIGHGSNWKRFNRIFRADRALTCARLKQIGDLRNDVFHFRREIEENDRNTLTATRDWMLRLVTLAREHEWG